jgi:hypothetical protein
MAEPLATALSWDIEVKPVIVSGQELSNYQAIARNDTGKVLSITKKSYYPATNERFREVISKIHEFSGFSVEGYSVFQEGRKVLAFLRNPEKMNIGGFDSTNYMVVGNSFDCTTGFFTGVTNVITRCTNQFSQIQGHMNIRHNSQIEMKLDELVRFYKRFLHQEQQLKETFEYWTNVEVNPLLIESFVDHVLDVPADRDEISSRKKNQKTSLFNSINREIAAMGPTVYGLFGGLTHYTTHVQTAASKLFGNSAGHSYRINQRGYAYLKEHAPSIN